jgi:FkbM family methyltransferase
MADHQTVAHRLRRFLRRFGVDMIRYPHDLPEDRSARLIRHHQVSIVLDVGAGSGQYVRELRDLGYRGRIVSFEPLASAYRGLAAKAAGRPDWTVVHSAVGDAGGTVTLNVAENRYSNSILPMLPAHTEAEPRSRYVATEEVPITTLDEAASPHLHNADRAFLKIDTQGYVKPVLDGAKALLDRTVGMQVKLSLLPLYEGDMLFPQGLETVTGLGFSLMGIQPGFHEHASGRTLQVQAVFFRE